MREILFRGAQKVDGCKSLYWYEGSLVSEKDGYTGEVEHYIQNESGNFLVIPETVGQYTGLTDKNVTKIFEGDILRYYDDEIQIVEWNKEFSNLMLHTYCKYERKKGRKVVIENSDGWNWLHDYPLNKMSIIGNIHDNPELLKEAEQE